MSALVGVYDFVAKTTSATRPYLAPVEDGVSPRLASNFLLEASDGAFASTARRLELSRAMDWDTAQNVPVSQWLRRRQHVH